jgi:tetratricopeptide (TPR) repeat protein
MKSRPVIWIAVSALFAKLGGTPMIRIAVLLTLFFALTAGLGAQRGGGGKPSNTGSNPTNPGMSPGQPRLDTTPRSFFLSGKVMLDDGTRLTDSALIQSNCKGRIRTEGYTDSNGHFSLEINGLKQSSAARGVDQAMDSSQPGLGQDQSDTRLGPTRLGSDSLRDYWRDCELQAVLPGFTSQVVEMAAHVQGDLGITDIGTIVLHRLNQVQGLTISATSARAPAKAKKEYEKGRDLEKREKWDPALMSFQKAVEVYPEYAIAWFEMGRVQVKKGDLLAARQSFQKSLSADSKFVSPYQELAQLALRDKQWQEVVDNTDALLKLNPINFPVDWLLNAAGNFYLQHLDAAEKSARRGLELDGQHQIPKLEYLLAAILAQKHDYAGALEHVRNYLRLAPHAADAETAQKQAEELDRLSAKTTADKP